jgi:hypothetical protein
MERKTIDAMKLENLEDHVYIRISEARDCIQFADIKLIKCLVR